jgi:competence protein ComEC
MEVAAALPFSSMDITLTFWQSLLLSIFLIPVLLPKGLVSRSYLGVLVLPLLAGFSASKNTTDSLSMQVFDVGQGLAVLIRTRKHSLLYDTGPAYGSGSSAAERVLLPYFSAEHLQNLSALVISHSDNDHAGGWELIRDRLKPEKLYAPEKDSLGHSIPCVTGTHWEWDGVVFEFVYPFKNNISHGKNDNSCVLKVYYRDRSILLTGDIEKNAEFAMLQNILELKSDIVFAPHHGSRTSSTQAFVQAIDARHVVIPAGFANRWRFPKQDVVERWQQNGAQLHTISNTGQLTFKIDQSANIKAQSWIQNNCHYWHQDCE